MNSGAALWPTDRDGFRLRGIEMTRIETFTDAAFAFAVSLLVISTQSVPTSFSELIDALIGVPAFALSFLLIMTFWYGHWQWSRRFGLDDMSTILLSGLLVFTVLVYVFPLKFLFTLAVAWVSRFRLATSDMSNAISSVDDLYHIFAIYGIGYAAMAFAIVLLNLHALRLRTTLGLDDLELLLTRSEITVWCVLGSVGLLSAITALLTPPSAFVWPGWIYMLLPVVMPIVGVRTNRRHKLLLAQRKGESPVMAASD